jgi:hypothetical protein
MSVTITSPEWWLPTRWREASGQKNAVPRGFYAELAFVCGDYMTGMGWQLMPWTLGHRGWHPSPDRIHAHGSRMDWPGLINMLF